MSIKIKELPELERPYEKLELYGAKQLSNAELLAIIIKTGTKAETSVQLAQRILSLNTSKEELNFLRELEIEDFMKIKGIGKVKAIQLKAVCELAIRMSSPSNYKVKSIKEPNDVAEILMQELRFEKREIAKVVLLNERNKIIKIVDITIGGSNFTLLETKDVLSEAIKVSAPKIIFIHNHPSGEVKPSQADIEFTEKLMDATDIMGIQLLDHIIIGNMKYTSIFTEIAKSVSTKTQKDVKKRKET